MLQIINSKNTNDKYKFYRHIEANIKLHSIPSFDLEYNKSYPINLAFLDNKLKFSEISQKTNISYLYIGLKDIIRSITGYVDKQFIENIKYRISRQYYKDLAQQRLTDTIEPTHTYMLRILEFFEDHNTLPNSIYTITDNEKTKFILKYDKYTDISLKNIFFQNQTITICYYVSKFLLILF